MGLLKNPNVAGGLKKEDFEPPSQRQYVGYIMQREKTPLKYKIDEGLICANIPLENARLVLPGEILIALAEINGNSTKLFCEVREEKAFEIRRFVTSKTSEGLKDMTHEAYETTITLRVRREISSDGYDGQFRNQNYSNAPIHLPNEEDLRTCFNLPHVGFPLGELVSQSTGRKITYYLPYNPSDFRPQNSEWQIDHSALVVGRQGRGKTNLLLYLSCLLASIAPEEVGARILEMAEGSNTSSGE